MPWHPARELEARRRHLPGKPVNAARPGRASGGWSTQCQPGRGAEGRKIENRLITRIRRPEPAKSVGFDDNLHLPLYFARLWNKHLYPLARA
jgi:hypothetical protein